MKNLFLSVLSSVFFSVLLFSCDTGSGNIQGHIDLNLIEHLEGKDLGGTTVKIKGRNEVAVTDIDGNFTLKNVEAGTFTLTISRDDWDTKETKIKVENGKIASLNETLDYSFAIIAGNLTGMPSSYMISLLKKDDESVNYQQITSSDFMIARIDQGSYKVTLTDSNSGSLVAAFQLDVPKNWYHFFTDIYNDEYLQSDNDETQFKKVTAGESHTCGIKEDGTLFCWGDNKYGQIGIGITGGYAAVPTKIGYDKWSDISAGGWHTCGIQEDGTLYCWGKNEFGGLGDGSYDDKPVPTKIDDSSWVEISAGGDHTCGIKNDNSLYCWGRSIEGQVGNERSGLGADESVPVKIGE
ncbi:MAG TPA: carboxypeptidase-like regulatory domain-containing protein, partial [bacterium]|nr:carboxypeptidase-like regulatory domain-containing protein [bacterium]